MATPTSSDVTLIGIDPGRTGAVAFYYDDGVMEVVTMPPKAAGIRALLDWRGTPGSIFAVIEHPQPIPHQRASSLATFWEHVGFLEGVLLSHGIPFEPVRPQDWRRALGCRVRGTKEAKAWSRAEAARRYPHLDLGKRGDEGRADAVLMAVYAKEVYEKRRPRGVPE